jgi:hypothetical protein
MYGKYLKIHLLTGILLTFVISCKEKEPSRPKPDVSKVVIDTTVIRFEQEMFSIPKGQVADGLKALLEKYPSIYPFYINVVLQIPDSSSGVDRYAPFMEEFIHYKDMRELYDSTQVLYGNFTPYTKQFHQAFRYYRHYFPEMPSPKLLTFIAQFGPRTFYYENVLGIGIDMYLGEYFKYYPSFDFPNYFLKRLIPENIVPDGVFTLVQDMIEDPMKRGSRLLDMMVYYGKIYYIASLLLPEMPVSKLFYYSEEDWQWCKDNEKQIWSFFIDGEWLYHTQYNDYRKFIDDAPTTFGMPQGAPDRVGRWTGYRIVKKYMERFPETTLQQLIALEDGQKILSKSGYKPGK